MGNIINSKERKARKEHICDYCWEAINKGEAYQRTSYVWEDKMYEWKTHLKCEYIASALWDYIDPDKGMSEQEFQDGVHEFCRTYICPDCEKWDDEVADCEMDESYCIDRVYDFLQTHELYRDSRYIGYEVWKLRKKEG